MKSMAKLSLLFLPFMLTSCNSEVQALAKRGSETICAYAPEEVTPAGPSYYVMEYSLGITSGKAKKVSKADFKAVVDGKDVAPTCILNNVGMVHSTWRYDKIVDEVEIPGEDSKETKWVNVGFAYDSGVNKSGTKFYFKSIEITTTSAIIKFK